ncbi:hypothetical protein SANTM175S_06053 [Streptomyces antimycoticus]
MALDAEFTAWWLAAVMSSDTWSCASARRFSGLAVAQRSHCVHMWSICSRGSLPAGRPTRDVVAISVFRAT